MLIFHCICVQQLRVFASTVVHDHSQAPSLLTGLWYGATSAISATANCRCASRGRASVIGGYSRWPFLVGLQSVIGTWYILCDRAYWRFADCLLPVSSSMLSRRARTIAMDTYQHVALIAHQSVPSKGHLFIPVRLYLVVFCLGCLCPWFIRERKCRRPCMSRDLGG